MIQSRFTSILTACGLALITLTTACESETNVNPSTDPLAFILEADDDATVDAVLFESEEARLAASPLTLGGEEGHRFTGDCFQLVYPITIALPDASEVTVDSAGGIRAALRAWIAANPNRPRPTIRPALVYPVDVQLADGTIQTLTSRVGLAALARSCRPEAEPCFTLVYPVSYTFGNTSGTFESAAEFRIAVRAYIRRNGNRPLSERERPHLIFPVQVETADGDVLTLDSPEMMRRLRQSCGGDRANGGRPHGNPNCYTFVFPISGSNAAGRTITVNNERELRRMLSHANDRGRFEIVFPINVTLANGTVTAIADPAALRALRRRCG